MADWHRSGEAPLRVAVIGIGAIASKAYLPSLTTFPGVELILVSRSRETLTAVGDRYRIGERYTSLEQALDTGLDAATLHTPSDTHADIAPVLLEGGVPLLVDKPLARYAQQAEDLASMARAHSTSLMVGFNRRHAPLYQDLRAWPDRDVVTMFKHRTGHPGPAREMVFDDFIHVIDTLRFLVPSELDDLVPSVKPSPDGRCQRVAIQFSGAGVLATGVMSWCAGLAQEEVDVIGLGRRRNIVNLSDIVDYRGSEALRRRDPWAPVAEQRGFIHLCRAFLDSVRDGAVLDAADAVRTHHVCEEMVRYADELTAAQRGSG